MFSTLVQTHQKVKQDQNIQAGYDLMKRSQIRSSHRMTRRSMGNTKVSKAASASSNYPPKFNNVDKPFRSSNFLASYSTPELSRELSRVPTTSDLKFPVVPTVPGYRALDVNVTRFMVKHKSSESVSGGGGRTSRSQGR